MIIHKDSHTDHLRPSTLEAIAERFADRTGFFIHTIVVPEPELCALYGPAMGDPPVADANTYRARRGDRVGESRMIAEPMRPVRTVTVVAGFYDGHNCVLYTAYAGPQAPREPWELETWSEEERAASEAFWAVHALADGNG
jgi:hypothetical protein